MEKVFRKIVLLVLVAVMVSSVFAFAGCESREVNDLKTKLEQLEEKLEQLEKDKSDLESEIEGLQDEVNELNEKLTAAELAIAKIEARIEIESYVKREMYSEDNWKIVCGIIDVGKTAVDAAENKDEVDVAVTSTKTTIDEVPKKEVPSDMNGAYFATGDSEDYALVKGNLITIGRIIPASQVSAINIVSDTFEFKLVDGLYVGSNIRKLISFKCLSDKLIIEIIWNGAATTKTTFKKSVDIELSNEDVSQLNLPQKNISINNAGLEIRPEEFMDQADAASISLNRNGILGVRIEVRKVGKEPFEVVGIRDFYAEPYCFFHINFNGLDLEQGANIIRVSYAGGLFLKNEKIEESKNSEAVYFNVTVDEQGNFIIEKI